ncbi:Tenascin-R [Trichinella pseudospiralis]
MQKVIIISLTALCFTFTNACLQSSQCNNLALCFRRQCISAEALYGQTKRCSRDIDCRRQLPAHERLIVGCKNGICAKLITVPNAGKCATRNQCPGQSICFRRHCIPAVPRNYSCQRNAQCHPTERCIGGLCFGLLGTTSESTRMLIGYPDDDTIDLL